MKPSNILLDRDGQAYLGDFGLVRSVDEEGMSSTGQVMGTSEYMSPEQIVARRAGSRCAQRYL